MNVPKNRIQEIAVDGVYVTPFKNLEEAAGCAFGDKGEIVPGFLIAMNAEKVMSARHNLQIRETLQMATIRYADGIGVVLALLKKGVKSSRIPGCDLWEKVMEQAGYWNKRVFLVGAKPNVLERVVEKLLYQSNVNVVGYQDGFFEPKYDEDVISHICSAKPEIITVAMGSPRQRDLL